MKFNEPKPKRSTEFDALAKVVRALELVGRRLTQQLESNSVVSRNELRNTIRQLTQVIQTSRDVVRRTRARPLPENIELYQLSDAEMSAKLQGLDIELSYAVATMTTALEKLHQKRYVSDRAFTVLRRYWMSVPQQYHQLLKRWSTATR
jgi:hypothetical protein